MLLQLKLATKGFVSAHDDEEIDFMKGPDLEELDEDEETDEEETNDPDHEHEEESDENIDDHVKIFSYDEEIHYSDDFFS